MRKLGIDVFSIAFHKSGHLWQDVSAELLCSAWSINPQSEKSREAEHGCASAAVPDNHHYQAAIALKSCHYKGQTHQMLIGHKGQTHQMSLQRARIHRLRRGMFHSLA